MESLVEEITKLTDEWYLLIGSDHHKDRDCHWYINTKWSYGYDPVYIVEHYGYVLDTIEETFPSYEEALKGLKNLLIKSIEEEKKWKLEND